MLKYTVFYFDESLSFEIVISICLCAKIIQLRLQKATNMLSDLIIPARDDDIPIFAFSFLNSDKFHPSKWS